jgi:hypothetical protein
LLIISTFLLIFLLTARYKDGEQLTDEDEKAVAGSLLVYHPNCDDKVGCGLDSIAVSLRSFPKGI